MGFHTCPPHCNQSLCSGPLWPCTLLIFRDRLVGLISFLFLHLTRQHGISVIFVSRFFFAHRQNEVAISCGALPCKSPSGSGPRLPLRSSVSSARCCLALSNTWAGSWATMCLQLLRWIFSRLYNERTASENVFPVLCKAVEKKTTVPQLRESSNVVAKKLPHAVASASLKGFITPMSAGCATDVLPGLMCPGGCPWEAQSEKLTQCGPEQHR